MTDEDVLKWIKRNISPFIIKAREDRPTSIYTEARLAGIACRETGQLIAKYIPVQKDPLIICSILRGDYTQRYGETTKQYHGFGITQIDIGSFPGFIKSGDWKDPYKCFLKTIDILNGKKAYLEKHYETVSGESMIHYITAAYNCGEGNEAKVMQQHLDPDAYTTGHNYSNEVARFEEIYLTI
jgi:hypothetical protein